MWLTRHELATMVAPDFIEKTVNEFPVKVIDARDIPSPMHRKNRRHNQKRCEYIKQKIDQ